MASLNVLLLYCAGCAGSCYCQRFCEGCGCGCVALCYAVLCCAMLCCAVMLLHRAVLCCIVVVCAAAVSVWPCLQLFGEENGYQLADSVLPLLYLNYGMVCRELDRFRPSGCLNHSLSHFAPLAASITRCPTSPLSPSYCLIAPLRWPLLLPHCLNHSLSYFASCCLLLSHFPGH